MCSKPICAPNQWIACISERQRPSRTHPVHNHKQQQRQGWLVCMGL
jgi:hypothetical protein